MAAFLAQVLLLLLTLAANRSFTAYASTATGAHQPSSHWLQEISRNAYIKGMECYPKDLKPPPKTDLVWEPANPPVYNGSAIPEVSLETANTFRAYTFTGMYVVAGEKPLSHNEKLVRLPYVYVDGTVIDCLIKEFEVEGETISACEHIVEKEVKIRFTVYTINSRNFMRLPYTAPDTKVVYEALTWLIETHEEPDDTINPNFNFVMIAAGSQIPLNAFKPGANEFAPLPPVYPNIDTSHVGDLKLVISWIPSACLSTWFIQRWIVREVCNDARWNIHGVYSELGEDEARPYPALDMAGLPVDELKQYSVSVSRRRNNEAFWTRQWYKHGRYTGFKTPKDYFKFALDWIKNDDVRKALSDVKQMASDTDEPETGIFTEKVLAIFQRSLKVKVELRCSVTISKTTNLLQEVRICFKYDGFGDKWELADCKANHCNKVDEPLIFPATFHTFPYVTLSLSWLPTQYARISHMTDETGQQPVMLPHNQPWPQWKIHGSCAHGRGILLRRTYGTIYVHLLTFKEWAQNVFNHVASLPGMRNQWPMLMDGNYAFYLNSWWAGCIILRSADIPALRGNMKYFGWTLERFAELRTADWMGTGPNQIQPGVEHSYTDLKKKFKAFVGVDVALICYRPRGANKALSPRTYLVKVRICRQPIASLALMDCPPSAVTFRLERIQRTYLMPNEERTCGDRIFVPTEPAQVV